MDTIIAAVQLVLNRDRTHAAFTTFSLNVTLNIAPGAEKQLTATVYIAGAGAAKSHAYVFIIWAVFNEHLNTRPFTAYY